MPKQRPTSHTETAGGAPEQQLGLFGGDEWTPVAKP